MFDSILREALNFPRTGRIPTGSWDGWLKACFETVERRFKFRCTWALLVGVTVAMLQQSGDYNAFFRVASTRFKRISEQRFKVYFIGLTHAFSGADNISETYRGFLRKHLKSAPIEQLTEETFVTSWKYLVQLYGVAPPQDPRELYTQLMQGYALIATESAN